MVVNYNETQLDTIKYQLNTLYNAISCKSAKKILYKTVDVNIDLYKELFLYKWATDSYIINGSFADVNNILTVEEFSCIAQKIKDLSC